MRETVCVTGGSGGIGRALLEQLVGRYQVRALFRTAGSMSEAWQRRGCTVVLGDLSDDHALSELVTGAKFVFHCAALTAQASYQDSYAVNVEGTRRLARAAAAHGCGRFVHVSTVAVYTGAAADGDYTEDFDISALGDMPVYAQTKFAAEQALKDVARESGLEYAILRPTSVYGPHTKPFTIGPLDLVRKGLPIIIGDGRGLMDVVYVDDVATAMVLAAESPDAAGETFNIGHEAVPANDFYSYYGAMVNRPARHVPMALVRTILRLVQTLPGAAKPARDQLRRGVGYLIQMAENTRRFSARKAAERLAYSPRYSLPLGMLATELWARSESRIEPGEHALDGYGALPFRPLAVVHPGSEAEIVQTIQLAAAHKLRVKAIGSLHSFAPIPDTDGVCVVLDRYRKCLSVDGPLVTVQAGMKLHELFDVLAASNLALPSNGAITKQTVTGAISTATHGGSIVHGSISDYVESLRIVKADGSVVDLRRPDDLFHAAVVSFGVLGVISTVTFRCVPAFVLRARSSVKTAQEVIDSFDEIHRTSPHTCISYFPVVDRMEVLQADTVEGAQTGAGESRQHGASASQDRTRFAHWIARTSLKGLVWVLRRNQWMQRMVTKRSVGRAYPLKTGRSDVVLALSDSVPTANRAQRLVQDMEVAVPYGQAPAALAVLREYFRNTRKFPLMAIHIRCSAPSELWLSPAYRRAVCYLEFWKLSPSDDIFEKVHDLLKPFHYRYHWGKETVADRAYISQQYERWNDFVALREEWDPKGLFLNRYVESLFSR